MPCFSSAVFYDADNDVVRPNVVIGFFFIRNVNNNPRKDYGEDGSGEDERTFESLANFSEMATTIIYS